MSDPANPPPQEPAHDVLAAEEFELPAGDPALRPRSVELPEDPSGIVEPHDVLAAEEFAMPAGPAHVSSESASNRAGRARPLVAVAGAVAGVMAFVARRRRRS